MTDTDNIAAADIVQHFWESGLMFIGFMVLFWWDGGALELKIVLALILVRVCFSWGEVAVLEKQISDMALQAQKQGAILQALLFELDQKLTTTHGSEEQRADSRDAARLYLEKIEGVESAIQQGYEGGIATRRIFSPSIGARVWVSIGGSVFQIAVLAFLAWGVTKLANAI